MFDEQVAAARGLECVPRWCSGEFQWDSAGLAEVVDLADQAGIRLHRWQVYALAAALAADEDGGWLHHTVGVLVPRQSGKTLMAHLRSALGLLRGETVVYTAQDRTMAAARFREGLPVWESIFGDRMKVRLANGDERITMLDGPGLLRVFTPSVNAPRGSTIDCIILDEAYRHDIALQGALEPTLLTKDAPQLWVLSNAGDHDSTLLRHYRDKGREGAPGFVWLEWAAPEGADGADPETWRTCMPSLGEPNGISLKRVHASFESMNPLAWEREMLNWWPLDDHGGGVIDMVAWASHSTASLAHDDRTLMLGAAVNRDRNHGAIVAASDSNGELTLEVIETHRGPTRWMAPKLAELCAKHDCEVVIDAGGPAGTLAAELAGKGVEVREVSMREYARACAMLMDRINAGPMSHWEDQALTNAAAVATKRRLGGDMLWAWAEPDRHADDYVPITPLEAASVAAYGALSREDRPAPRIHLVGSGA